MKKLIIASILSLVFLIPGQAKAELGFWNNIGCRIIIDQYEGQDGSYNEEMFNLLNCWKVPGYGYLYGPIVPWVPPDGMA